MQSGINIFSPVLPSQGQRALPELAAHEISRRFVRFNLGIFLLQVLLCALPAAGLLAVGRASLAGHYFFAMLGLVLLRLALVGRRDEILCVILAVGPFINLLRSFAFYNVIIGVFALGLFYYFALSSGTVRDTLKKFPLVWALGIAVTIFYVISFVNTHEYSVNLRLFELVFAVVYVLVIGRNPVLLGATLLGLILCAGSLGLAMLPHLQGGRLGIIATGGTMLGNPTQLGIPLAFGFLTLTVDRGRWLNLESKPILRFLLLLPILGLLALTTSRAAWLVAGGGIFLNMLFGSRQRFKMLFAIALVIGGFVAVLHSPYGDALAKGLKRTFADNRSARQRSSGRSDQWKVAWYAFNKSADAMIFGYGPGRGPEIYAKYSGLVDGVKYGVGKKATLHSVFMQVGVEGGLIGLLLILTWLAVCFFKIAKNLSSRGMTFPLVCFFGYVFIVLTVSGGDINSGIFLGIALLGTVFATAKPVASQGEMEPSLHPANSLN